MINEIESSVPAIAIFLVQISCDPKVNKIKER